MSMRTKLGWEYAQDVEGSEKVVDFETVIDLLNDIEHKVNNALVEIKGIQGIERIEECQKILEQLSSELY